MAVRRGAVLLEIVVALAIFVGAGAVVLGSVMNVNRSLAASRDRQVAIDIARSKMAELEAGIMTVERLNDEMVSRRVEPLDSGATGDDALFAADDEASSPFGGFGANEQNSGIGRNEAMRSAVRSFDGSDGFDLDAAAGGDPAGSRWRLEVRSEPSRFGNLSIVTIRVFDTLRGDDPEQGVEVYVLRQLVRLASTGDNGETDYEQDDVFDDLGGGFTNPASRRGGSRFGGGDDDTADGGG